MREIYRLLYCSRNSIEGTQDEIETEVKRILAKSRANNGRDGVTGGLLFSAGTFAQVLEGPLPMVERAFERIQCDDRHCDVTVLESGVVAARAFADWSMAFAGRQDGALAHVPLGTAFDRTSAVGAEVLALLRSVVTREDEWAMGSV